MNELQFLHPQLVHLLWGVAAFGLLLLWLERRARGALDRLISVGLQGRLVDAASPAQRVARILLLILALGFAVLALMRPQLGVTYVATQRSSAELMIALDVSRSMLAEDTAPNRLERAKAEIRDLLPYLDGDHVGLIAFAGRATVLAPLTPDFGFLRLVLDGAGPHSVGRGGTRLEEPIRKALAGFRASGDLARAILLITDGEDHDSFAVEAAREAAERGVSIIAIGFGSETGSEIPLTDPYSGARTILRDADGRAVMSRLDGDLLRELALMTDGAYVPAGTGVLDLESIYARHLAGLLRARVEGEGRAVRQEAFQWALLGSLFCLIASVLAGLRGRRARRAAPGLASALMLLGSFAFPVPSSAQQGEPNASTPAPAQDEQAPIEPREAYNQALARISEAALDPAEELLADARGRAGSDGELRFRTALTLGWLAAARADAQLQSAPEEALAGLHTAADWYRDAIRLRPEDTAARKSLEIVLQRALVLADSLRDPDAQKLEQRLDALIERQRGLVGLLGGLLERTRGKQDEPDELLRREFRGLSTTQREALAEGDALADVAEQERAALAETPAARRPMEERIREAQLAQLLEHLHRGRERMGQTRRDLRRRRAERAFRRGAASLAALKRAREALADPLRVLDAVLRDAAELNAWTRVRADPGTPAPAWLTLDYLAEAQPDLTARSHDLQRRLVAGARSLADEAAQQAEADPERQRLMRAVQEAVPLLGDATSHFEGAERAFFAQDPALAGTSQDAAIDALIRAREAFLDLRGLIEAAWQGQRHIGSAFGADDAALVELLPGLREFQSRNVTRGARIAALVDERLASLPPGDDDPEVAAERQRMTLAAQLTIGARDAMARVAAGLPSAGGALDRAALAPANVSAVEALAALRRLFFSVVEHLRETAQRQQQLNDETETLAAVSADPNGAPPVEPLVPRQRTLQGRAAEIAEALEEQSRNAATPGPAPPAPAQGPDPETLRRAAEHVLASGDAMNVAAGQLAVAPPLGDARSQQDEALAQLLQALALLTPPQEQQGEPEQGEGESDQTADASQAQPGSQESQADPGQLLQSVRDREQQRRRERERRARRGNQTVEKDW